MKCGVANHALWIGGTRNGHVRNGATVEVDGRKMSLFISVKDCVGAALFIDVESAERGLRHGNFSQSVPSVPRSIAELLH